MMNMKNFWLESQTIVYITNAFRAYKACRPVLTTVSGFIATHH